MVVRNSAFWNAKHVPYDLQENAPDVGSAALWTNERAPEIVHIQPRTVLQLAKFELLQQWEGTVVEVGDEDFVAHLQDRSDPCAPLEKATIALDELADQDIPLVHPGALFEWTIGYRTLPHGQKITESAIVFRRIPSWSKRELEQVEKEAAVFDELLGIGR